MALTSGERSALWRKRQRDDKDKHEEYKRKERERNKRRKQSGDIKSIEEMTNREKRKQRKRWKTNQQNKRARDSMQKKAIFNQITPPQSPDHINIEEANYNQRAKAGRKKKNLNRSKAYREQFKLRIELNKVRRLREKYRKRLYRLKKKTAPSGPSSSRTASEVTEIIKHNEKKSALLLFTVIAKNIRNRYQHCSAQEKRFLKNLIYRENTLRKYGLQKYAKTLMKVNDRKIRCTSSTRKMKKCALRHAIEEFYQRDDNSRLKAGKKSTITKKGEKKQIRLLNDTLKNLHKKYVFEKQSKMSYSLFASLRPFWIRHASEKDRETCLCKYHENPQLKANRLFHEKFLEKNQLTTLVENITCSTTDKACMYRECDKCKDKKLKLIKEPTGRILEWKVWRVKRLEREVMTENGESQTKKYQMTVKEKESGTDEALLKELQIEVERLARHIFNINHQYNQLRILKNACNDDEVIVHIDFSENYICKYEDEIQSVHFGASKRQISIHTGMAYSKEHNLPFATVSDCLKHAPGAIWAHLEPVIIQIKTLNPNLKRIHFLSDGPTTQYRNRNNFYLFATRIYESGFSKGGSWNFLESGHGKGAPDGIGSVIKRTADSLVNTTKGDVTCSADIVKDLVYWSELRFDEGGRYVICSHKAGGEGNTDWTPKGYNARTRVHEYGGGASFIHKGKLYFSNYEDQCMYTQSGADAAPVKVTEAGTFWRYADGRFCEKTGRIYCVREDHSGVENKTAKEPVNMVVTINPENGKQNVLAEGCDFYSCPRVSPDGKKIAWVQWNHPNMPWDSTELYLADLTDDGSAVVPGSAKQVVGGENVSVMQPGWTCDNELLYICDKTDWWNLYMVKQSGEHVNLLERSVECGSPHWVFGNSPYCVDPRGNGDIVTVYGKEMGVYNVKSGSYRVIDTGNTSHRYLNVGYNGMAYCVAGSPTSFSCVLQLDIATGKATVLKESKVLSLSAEYFSIPEEIKWTTSEGQEAHGYFYKPVNKDYTAPDGTLPPLLVKNHGGPTSSTSDVLSLNIQYFTSRGMAVLDVNYRGSTGYGKTYRHKLRHNWGVYDIDDSCYGATHLADTGKVDRNMLCIDGGSAGGYTTLAALTFKDVFKAGASHYGIGDLTALADDTHKFESRYLDSMIGPYKTDADKKVYQERSPINYVDKLDCALALFQGDEDKIVPPNQAEMMHKAVKAKGKPCMYVLFQGEQHGFRKSENIQTALDGEFYFFSKVFGYEPADKHINIPIDNLS